MSEPTQDYKRGYNAGFEAGELNGKHLYSVKALTDEEIADFLYAYCLDMGNVYEVSEEQFIKCVRAILRNAQDK